MSPLARTLLGPHVLVLTWTPFQPLEGEEWKEGAATGSVSPPWRQGSRFVLRGVQAASLLYSKRRQLHQEALIPAPPGGVPGSGPQTPGSTPGYHLFLPLRTDTQP